MRGVASAASAGAGAIADRLYGAALRGADRGRRRSFLQQGRIVKFSRCVWDFLQEIAVRQRAFRRERRDRDPGARELMRAQTEAAALPPPARGAVEMLRCISGPAKKDEDSELTSGRVGGAL